MQAASVDDGVEPIVAGVAHDFGNLLAVITNYVSLASRRVEEPTTLELLEQVRVAATRATRLNRQLHDLGECGALTIQPVEVNDLVRALEPQLHESLGEGCGLRVDLDEAPLRATASRNGLEMVLRHLVDNAREAMADGGVVTIATRSHTAAVEVSVSDTGVGMPPEVQERAFEPRFSTRPRGHVSGLGLTIVGRVVRTLGGEVHLESVEGSGTTVRLRLAEASGG